MLDDNHPEWQLLQITTVGVQVIWNKLQIVPSFIVQKKNKIIHVNKRNKSN